MRCVVPSLRFLFVAVVVACAPGVGGCSLEEEPSSGSAGGAGGAGGAAGKGGAGSAGKGGSVASGGTAGATGTASGTGGKAGSAGATGAGGSAGAGGAAGSGGKAGSGGVAGAGGTAGSGGAGGAAGSGGAAGAGGTAGSGGAGGAAGSGGTAGAGGAAGSSGAAGSGGATVDSGLPDATRDAPVDTSIDQSVEAGPSGDAGADTGSNGEAGNPDTSVVPDAGTADAASDAATTTDVVADAIPAEAASDAGDAGCTGSVPSSPDGGGNAANVAQGGSVMIGGNCGNVSADESPAHAFDNSVQSKWLCFVQASDAFAVPPVTYRLAGGSTNAVNAYTVTSANDVPGRDPASWRLEGSLDEGATWATLDTQVGQTFTARFQTNAYVIPNCSAYGRYRFVVTETAGGLGSGAIFQVAEIQLFGPQGHGPTDLENRATGGTVTTASTCGGANANEAPDKAFDGDLGSKWFCGSNAAPSVDVALTAPRAVTSYAITNGNDAPDRDPKSWTLQGSNDADAGTWATLDTQTNQAFASRNQTLTYSFTNATSYAHYRFAVTANNGSVDFQVGEIMLFGN